MASTSLRRFRSRTMACNSAVEIVEGGVIRKLFSPKSFAGGNFARDVNLRCRIFADENRGKSRDDSGGSQAGDFLTQIGVDFFADGVAVEDSGRQEWLPRA